MEVNQVWIQICFFPRLIALPRLEPIFTNPSARAGFDTRSIFKRILTGLNSEFSFSQTSCLTKAEDSSLPYYLPIAGGRIIGFIPVPRVLVQCEMQSVSSRIWTRVAVSISYDDNHYTTGTSTRKTRTHSALLFAPICVCGVTDVFILFSLTLERSETPTASSWFWTQHVDSILYDDNYYAKHAPTKIIQLNVNCERHVWTSIR